MCLIRHRTNPRRMATKETGGMHESYHHSADTPCCHSGLSQMNRKKYKSASMFGRIVESVQVVVGEAQR